MPRICIVKECRENRKSEGAKKVSLFRTPKCLELRNIWSQNLKVDLKETDRVCELHFDSEQFANDDSKCITPDSRIRRKLKHTAVPKNSKSDVFKDVVQFICENPMRMNWSWIKVETGIIFCLHYGHKKFFHCKCYIRLESDLSFEVLLPGESYVLRNGTINNTDDLMQLFIELEKLTICDGIGIPDKKRTDECVYILGENTYSKNLIFQRCLACREFRRNAKSHTPDAAKKLYLAKRYANLQVEANNLRKKCKRYKNQLESLKVKSFEKARLKNDEDSNRKIQGQNPSNNLQDVINTLNSGKGVRVCDNGPFELNLRILVNANEK